MSVGLRGRYVAILRLGFPILIGQLGMIVTGFADTKMVGSYSTEALASASFVNNLFNVTIFALLGFTYGLTPIIGALFTRNSGREIGATVRTGLIVNVLFSLLITGIMTLIYFNIDRLGQPAELLPVIRPYYLIYMAGMIPISVFNVFAQWAYSINNTRMPMWIVLGANALNIFLNWLLIYGSWGFPELGLTGAGLATLTARLICPAAIMAAFFLRKEYKVYSIGFRSGRTLDPALFKEINLTSWPVAMQMAFESGSFTIAAIMAGWLGKIPLAAFQLIVMTGTLGFCIYYSMGAAVAVLVANAAGAGDRRLMRRTAFSGYHIMLTLATLSSLTFIFAGPGIMRWFTDDSTVVAAAVACIVPLVLYQYGDATQINFANALRGTAKVMPMLWIAFVSYIVIGIPATYLMAFTFDLGLRGIVGSFSISLFTAALLFILYFLRATRHPS